MRRASPWLLIWALACGLAAGQGDLDGLNEEQLEKRIAVHLDRKQAEPALAAAEQWTRVAPRSPEAWAMVGRLRTELGRLEGAEEALSRLLAMDPGRARAWADRAALRLRLERPAEAIEDATQALDLDEGLALGWFVRGLAQAAQGRHEAAIADYHRAIAASPPYPKARYARGEARKALGEAEAASADCAAALELDKEAASPWGVAAQRGRRDGHADLSHVVVGQRYTFEMMNNMQMVWEVLEVGEDQVRYEVVMFMDLGQGLAPIGEPTEQHWSYTPPPAGEQVVAPLPAADTSRETVTVSGLPFDCLVVSASAAGMTSKSWATMTPGSDSVPTFPGAVKVMTDGEPSMVLIRVETPKAR